MAAVNNNGKKNFKEKFKKKGPCWECGGPHFKRDCWELPENASKRLNNWVSRKTNNGGGEVGGATITGWKGHSIMCATTGLQMFPDSMEVLNDPDIWVADTAATTDMTRHITGLFRLKDADKSDSAMTSNGTLSNAKKIGKLAMIQCNNQGTEQT
ncbi:unknown protein [Seminavis robusta]|uniref:Uncharacterized protein n=1 Tax=Seminavis robusta TaxID=568900 RepID=A0A9N8EEI6_9STRA|nr:unknown protein [Seminavis robusta]|eukprot:Sro882_g215400.1 n/a (155) ;mRNA; r:40175-40639